MFCYDVLVMSVFNLFDNDIGYYPCMRQDVLKQKGRLKMEIPFSDDLS